MKLKSRFMVALSLLIVSLFGQVAAEDLKIEPAKPQNGVYFCYTGYMTTVLELEDGQFRYWFESDSKRPNEPTYPLTGKYSTDGSNIILVHDQVYQKKWLFRTVNGFVSLWRRAELDVAADKNQSEIEEFFRSAKNLKRFKNFGIGRILVPSKKPAQEVWKHRTGPTL